MKTIYVLFFIATSYQTLLSMELRFLLLPDKSQNAINYLSNKSSLNSQNLSSTARSLHDLFSTIVFKDRFRKHMLKTIEKKKRDMPSFGLLKDHHITPEFLASLSFFAGIHFSPATENTSPFFIETVDDYITEKHWSSIQQFEATTKQFEKENITAAYDELLFSLNKNLFAKRNIRLFIEKITNASWTEQYIIICKELRDPLLLKEEATEDNERWDEYVTQPLKKAKNAFEAYFTEYVEERESLPEKLSLIHTHACHIRKIIKELQNKEKESHLHITHLAGIVVVVLILLEAFS